MDPPSVIPPQLDTSPCWLCKDCESVLIQPWEHSGFVEHKPNYYALQNSASEGCELCKYFCSLTAKALDDSIYDADITLRETLALGNQGSPCRMHVNHVYSVEPFFRGWIDELQYIPSVRPYDDDHFVERDKFSSRFGARISLLAGKNEYIGGRVVPASLNLERCNAWIEECHRTHDGCRKTGMEDQELPTRLIDVGIPDSHASIRLMIPENMKGRYVALSHRWGNPAPPTTTTINLQHHLRGIPLETLPQMFQDAVLITQRLGYRYLWIDSLCIVQDDRDDWHREYPRMTSTYRNAAVTIAGPGCEKSDDALLRPRKMPSVKRILRVKSNDSAVDCVLQLDNYNTRYFGDYPGHSHLSNRAWVLQERLLSPRVLYFGPRHMYFECNSSRASEGAIDTPYSLDIRGGGAAKDILELPNVELYENWHRLVEDYSERFITFETDRLPGIAGLAGLIQQRLRDDYWAGLWRRDFVNGLQWQRASKEPHSTGTSEGCGPSWSWVSCNYRIKYGRRHEVHSDIGLYTTSRMYSSPEHIKVVDMSLDMGGKDSLGQVSKGRMRISGRLKDIYIGKIARGFRDLAVYSADPKRSRVGVATMDEPKPDGGSDETSPYQNEIIEPYPVEDAASATRATCVLVSSGTEWFPGDSRTEGWLGVWVGLLLESVAIESSDTPTFRRIGLAHGHRFCGTADAVRTPEEVKNPAAYFGDAEDVTIDVV